MLRTYKEYKAELNKLEEEAYYSNNEKEKEILEEKIEKLKDLFRSNTSYGKAFYKENHTYKSFAYDRTTGLYFDSSGKGYDYETIKEEYPDYFID